MAPIPKQFPIPTGEFIARKGFTFAGETYISGDDFPTDGVTPRRLVQLYEGRFIIAKPTVNDEDQEPVKKNEKNKKVRSKQEGFKELTEEELFELSAKERRKYKQKLADYKARTET